MRQTRHPQFFAGVAINFSSFCPWSNWRGASGGEQVAGSISYVAGHEALTAARPHTDGFSPAEESKSCLSGYPGHPGCHCHESTRVISRTREPRD